MYSKVTANTESNDVRVLGAQVLLKKLKKYPDLSSIIEQMEFTAEALIQLAYKDHEACQKTQNGKNYTIPGNLKIQKIKNYSNMLLPTYELPLRKNCTYDDVIGKILYTKWLIDFLDTIYHVL